MHFVQAPQSDETVRARWSDVQDGEVVSVPFVEGSSGTGPHTVPVSLSSLSSEPFDVVR